MFRLTVRINLNLSSQDGHPQISACQQWQRLMVMFTAPALKWYMYILTHMTSYTDSCSELWDISQLFPLLTIFSSSTCTIWVRPGSDTELFMSRNLIHWINYMKSSTSESIRNACFNFWLTRPNISILGRLWNTFDSDVKLSMCWTWT